MVAVTLRVVIVAVDDEFARQQLDRNLAVVLRRHGNDDHISSLRCFGGRRAGSVIRADNVSGPRELLITTLWPCATGESGNLASDGPGADDADGPHSFSHTIAPTRTRGRPVRLGAPSRARSQTLMRSGAPLSL